MKHQQEILEGNKSLLSKIEVLEKETAQMYKVRAGLEGTVKHQKEILHQHEERI